MSGGFFRGTSFDQDTRFSNKQAKLLKSQKFAPELDHLVDMTKVKMDVMRPWIASRVTELLGFEDEVLINFIYGLLDGKEVNGKEVQISLTGFMEKNTGKFMKELWSLLVSAQKNASGIPQQFLDAKEEETKKKKAETDRIANDFKRQIDKETWELEMGRMKKMDGELDLRDKDDAVLDQNSKNQPRASGTPLADNKEKNERIGSKARSRSPRFRDHSPSRSRSISKSFSHSRSFSDGRQRSRSISGSPRPRGRSISSERVSRSPPRRSITPHQRRSPDRSLSPLRRRSSHSKGRSTSRSRYRSPSPPRRRLRSPVRGRSRSPIRRRSRSPIRRRSRSPIHRMSRPPVRGRSRPPVRGRSRSPIRGRSRSPIWRSSRSPIWRRSRSPLRHRYRSPLRRRLRSPIRRRSPSTIHRRSRSPFHRRFRSPIQQRSPSPVRRRYQRSPSTPSQMSLSPVRHRSSGRRRSRSPLPQELSSSSPSRRISPSPDRRSSLKHMRSSPRGRIRSNEKYSPVGRALPTEDLKHKVKSCEGSDSLERQPSLSSMSPRRDLRDQNNSGRRIKRFSPSPSKSLSVSESPPTARRRTPSEYTRSFSAYGSPVKQTRESVSPVGSQSPQNLKVQKSHCYSPDTVEEVVCHARDDLKYRDSGKISFNASMANEQNDSIIHHFDETQSLHGSRELQNKDLETSEIGPGRVHHPKAYDKKMTLINHIGASSDERREETYSGQGHKADEKNLKRSDQLRKSETMSKLSGKVDQHGHNGSVDSGTEESDKVQTGPKEKRKHKRSRRRELATDDDSYDSLIEEGRKEAKKRKKEEKKQRKEERRRRREERRRRREERRKLKLKSGSDFESNRDGSYASGGEHVSRRDSRANDIEEESDPKKLEIELREKALETLRARKGVGH